MSTGSLALPFVPRADVAGWRGHLVALCLMIAAILTLFWRDLFDMISIWWNASTFGHCLFIPLLVGWLIQQRADGLAKLEPVAWRPGLAWLALGGFIWLVGAAAGVAMVRQGALVVMAQGATVALLGPAVARALTFPLFYAFFMVPGGDEIVAPLQILTAKIAMALLGLFGVPAHIDGIFITIPNGYFEVAEACSGAKFVIAMTAYGALVCNVCFRRWGRRIAFLAGALTLSVLANGVRAFATIYVAHLTSVDAAVGFDHVVYGWVFFALVMVVVMAAAWPFFDRGPSDPWFDPRELQGAVRRRASTTGVVLAGLALIAAAPLWLAVTTAASPPLPSTLTLPDVPGWTRTDARPAYPWKPRFDGADRLALGRYRDAAGQVVDMAIVAFDRQEDKRKLVGFAQGAADPNSGWTWSAPAPAPANARGEQITAPGPVIRHVVSFYGVGGAPLTGSAAAVKAQTLKARLLMGDQRAVGVLVSAEEGDGRPSDRAIAAFLHGLGDVQLLADRSVGIR
jgi:exosortase A